VIDSSETHTFAVEQGEHVIRVTDGGRQEMVAKFYEDNRGVYAERAGQLQMPNRDPFDRVLIAQAQAEDLWLVSNEKVFDSAGVRRLW
jgi:hypothetical protein